MFGCKLGWPASYVIHSNFETCNYRPKLQRDKPPLYLMEIVILGKLSFNRSVAKPIIEKMGGKLTTHIHERTAVIISNEREIERMNDRMQQAKDFDIQVVPEEFLEEVKGGGAVDYIAKNSISEWGSDVIFDNLVRFVRY